MAGVYIHIPFCRKACVYCDFYFSTSLKAKDDFLNALLDEIVLRSNYLNEPVETIYFGGGTPSVLKAEEINTICNHLSKHFDTTHVREVTMEANPDDLTPAYIEALQATPVNRLSLGVQSFLNERLQWMNRSHTSEQSILCIAAAIHAGFTVSIDLIFSLPGMSREEWQQQLEQAVACNTHHISVYQLTVEPKTQLAFLVKKDAMKEVPDEQAEQFFLQADAFLVKKGFNHYEISNYAREGFAACHNSNYWNNISYIGLGPSAHSYDGISRSWNVNNNQQYLKSIAIKSLPSTTEVLSPKDMFNEFLLVRLRTRKGFCAEELALNFGFMWQKYFLEHVEPFLENGRVVLKDKHYFIPVEYWFISDSIVSDLFYPDEQILNA
jgi:oxygen-independent coproporphyrinogen-3 oxidase